MTKKVIKDLSKKGPKNNELKEADLDKVTGGFDLTGGGVIGGLATNVRSFIGEE